MSAEAYFAYGSNLLIARLVERVPGARVRGIGHLAGHRLVCDKVGRDGSAKANLERHPEALVWGALYDLPAGGLDLLDPFEGGYARFEVGIQTPSETHIAAVTYVSEKRSDDRTPFDWYREMILDGARAHGLPADYLRALGALPSRPDPRRPR